MTTGGDPAIESANAASPALLTMDGISKRFGPTHALRDVNLSISAGEIHALIGENGAGKSTLMKVLSGALAPDGGQMTLRGAPYRPPGPAMARRAGVSMIYQELNLAPDLNVEDNVMLGQEIHVWGWLTRRAQRRRVAEVLELLGHPELRPAARVRELSIGALQLVEIARALLSEPQVLILDEPTSSLPAKDVDHLFLVLKQLRETGIGIIYISHFLEEVRNVCDRCSVLRDGQSIGTYPLDAIDDTQIISLMVGRSVDDLFPTVPHEPAGVRVKLDDIKGDKLPVDVRGEIRSGEILGIAGLVGAGRTETLRCLFGLDPMVAGRVEVDGSVLSSQPRSRMRQGFGMVSEDRKAEGLAQELSIVDNITLNHLAPYSRFGWLALKARKQRVVELMTQLSVKAAGPRQFVSHLSGGNQQKVAIARVLHQDADIFLLDEPTRGVDVGTKAEIYRLIGQLAAAGKSIVFVSSYLPELMAVCDRIGVMVKGRLVEIRETSQWTEEDVMRAAIGGELSGENSEA